jgi:hypothetical protein
MPSKFCVNPETACSEVLWAKAEQLFEEGEIAEYIKLPDTALLKFPADCPHKLRAQIQALENSSIDKKGIVRHYQLRSGPSRAPATLPKACSGPCSIA